MQVTSLKLNSFRNYERLTFKPNPGMNLIMGENAQGKTNLLEALFMCAFLRSHRTSRDAETIMHGCSGAYIGTNVKTRSGERLVELKLPVGERKKIFLDRLALDRSADFMGTVNVVLFSPEELRLIKDVPAERRRFMDMELSQLKPAYFLKLQKYNTALKQRNALIKTAPLTQLPTLIEPWNEQLAECGAQIMLDRIGFIKTLAELAPRIHFGISSGKETLSVEYAPNISSTDDPVSAIYDALTHGLQDDIRRGFTGTGPHRDDIRLRINDDDIRVFCSQGQQRTAALSLKLSEIELIRSVKNDTPILLLDDVFSELDEQRRGALIKATEGCQCFLTTTEADMLCDIDESAAVYVCTNGRLEI